MVKTIYVKCDSHSKVNQDKVYLKDVAEVYCADSTLAAKAKTVLVSHLKKKGERKVISVLYIMEQIEKVIPEAQVQSIGETDIIVEWQKPEKGETLKVAGVCFIAFFGTAFTIMAFHNDIGIRSVFEEVYHLTSGMAPEGVGILELSYCLGLFLGITVFFNHIGKKKFTDDPTPVAVAMHNYERDVNQSIVENAERRGAEESE
ncbi:MAG: stage V sporulation protein AA [Lachnospiraceae bacterium]|nr:stage V sporulation protein AA [Lachnospiraceae bacterium]